MNGKISNVDLKFTQEEYVFVNEVVGRISYLNAIISGNAILPPSNGRDPFDTLAEKGQVTMELLFETPKISLELMLEKKDAEEPVSFAKVIAHEPTFKVLFLDNGVMNAEIAVRKYAIEDTRTDTLNVFKMFLEPGKIDGALPAFLLGIERDMYGNGLYKILLDNPAIVVLFDQLCEIVNFFNVELPVINQIEYAAPQMWLEIKIRNFALSLLRDLANENSDSIQLKIKSFLFKYRNTHMSLWIRELSAFFCAVKQEGSDTRFIESLDVQYEALYGDRVEYDAQIGKILFRISYREAFLLADILENINKNLQNLSYIDQKIEPIQPEEIHKIGQMLRVRTEGVRVIVIDDLNNLHFPMFDIDFQQLSLDVSEWVSLIFVRLQTNL